MTLVSQNYCHEDATTRLGGAAIGPWSIQFRDYDTPAPRRRHIDPHLRDEFTRLAEEWLKDTWLWSSSRKKISHPAYLQIIAIGKPALPLIFERLRAYKEPWYPALDAITKQDLAPDATSPKALFDAWMEWAEKNEH